LRQHDAVAVPFFRNKARKGASKAPQTMKKIDNSRTVPRITSLNAFQILEGREIFITQWPFSTAC
jgi:hypothetical protein